ncbi:bifunctional (p)ppGpp synthetase/guanosine-3',5'-bis(diphosphate) 3'-pyrophosphohydrolase [Candidatus Amesbacteria bacterium]|nr:bifunctional (p)ppGpp synthetase/guanosine-3',5'-bis(diphosphate) 3'-pyrophosphohydrolase [Candidatus Amesbacteria bacterium]
MNPLLTDLLSSLDQTPRPIDRDLITKAWEFANLAHSGNTRDSGQPYITHPTQVAKTLALWNMDTTTIVAGLMHDTIEEGGATRQDLVKEFGEEVAQLVDGVTKVTDIRLKGSGQEDFVENLRKMILVMARDLRVVMVKLADRLHNMQTLQYLDKQRQLDNAKETLEIYAPLADRLGMGELKGQLEDLSFPYVYPDEFAQLTKSAKKLFAESEKYTEKFKRELLILLIPQIPSVVINIRHKHLYSLWRKLQRPDRAGDITKIHDLVAARVLVDSVEDCYSALGLIHTRFHPVPYLGMRDFIANPKPNGYHSIHTNVFGPEGRIVEIQIRTFEMHDQAEHGIAAHWQYSAAKSSVTSDEKLEAGHVQVTDKLSWVKQLAAWQKEITDNQEYLQTLKFDALQHRNLVFSPIGDVYDLPAGATPIDYAYAVHTDLGHQANGAKVNGKMVPLNHKLVNGDVVEIMIDRKRAKPSHAWLSFVVTTTARHQITKALKN